MDLYLDDDVEIASDPMDTVETVLGSDDRFKCERADDGDVHFSFKGSLGETVGYFSFRDELPALLFTLGFDLQAPNSRRAEAVRLASLINENLWLGHFDVWSDDGTIIFRHAMPMIGREEISIGEIQAMLAAGSHRRHRARRGRAPRPQRVQAAPVPARAAHLAQGVRLGPAPADRPPLPGVSGDLARISHQTAAAARPGEE
jgi:hypothetical protein